MPANKNQILLYGVIAAQNAAEVEAALSILVVENVAAVYIEVAELSNEIAVLTHFSNVIETLHRRLTIVPFRYGSIFASRAELQIWLSAENEVLSRKLAEIEDLTEMSVRVLLEKNQNAPIQSESGRDYLLARAAQISGRQKQIEELTAILMQHFSPVAQQSKHEIKEDLLSFYFLIPKTEIDDFRRLFLELQSKQTAKMSLSGNWSPFNFVD